MLLNEFLALQCLVICSKTLNYFLISTYDLNPKVKLSPTDLIYLAPPSSLDLATARNPNQFDLTDGMSVSPRWACKHSVACCNYFGPTEICSRSHRVCLTNYLFAYYQNRSHRVCVIGQIEFRFYPNPSTSVPPR